MTPAVDTSLNIASEASEAGHEKPIIAPEVNSSSAYVKPIPSQSPMGKNASGNSANPSANWMSHPGPTNAIDGLLGEFENSFERIASVAGSLLARSRSIRGSGQSAANVSDSYSLLGARQSAIYPMQSNEGGSMHSSQLDGNLDMLSEDATMSSESAAEVSAILEKYSDKLVTLVSEKMLASSQQKNPL